MKTRRKSTYWGLIVVLMAALLVGGCGQTEEAVKETEISVNTAQATERNIAKSVRYAGTVRGQNEVYLIAKVPARVTGIHVNPGDKVSQGQKLITLDSSDYQAAVAQAQAGVKAATLQLENARLGLERTEKLMRQERLPSCSWNRPKVPMMGPWWGGNSQCRPGYGITTNRLL